MYIKYLFKFQFASCLMYKLFHYKSKLILTEFKVFFNIERYKVMQSVSKLTTDKIFFRICLKYYLCKFIYSECSNHIHIMNSIHVYNSESFAFTYSAYELLLIHLSGKYLYI